MKHSLEDMIYIKHKASRSWAKEIPALSKNAKEQLIFYAIDRLVDEDVRIPEHHSLRLLTVTEDVNNGYAVILMYGTDLKQNDRYIIYPDTIVKF